MKIIGGFVDFVKITGGFVKIIRKDLIIVAIDTYFSIKCCNKCLYGNNFSKRCYMYPFCNG